MEGENAKDFFAALGFEATEIEDGLTALCYETGPQGGFALLTDNEGALPESLERPLVFACYTPDGAYEWSAGFKDALEFKDVWTEGATAEEKLAALHRYRERMAL
ncbi:hypothetical protein [Anaeroselena agilis]|uniref:Uncharacterized protein n=1 Tax=Anaeroselena agilis TaxID=3063788 RepID=A0ABU3P2N4_9FIRM|nr:hypothetical protein [Selenomonadales bacterium 4137-cl]